MSSGNRRKKDRKRRKTELCFDVVGVISQFVNSSRIIHLLHNLSKHFRFSFANRVLISGATFTMLEFPETPKPHVKVLRVRKNMRIWKKEDSERLMKLFPNVKDLTFPTSFDAKFNHTKCFKSVDSFSFEVRDRPLNENEEDDDDDEWYNNLDQNFAEYHKDGVEVDYIVLKCGYSSRLFDTNYEPVFSTKKIRVFDETKNRKVDKFKFVYCSDTCFHIASYCHPDEDMEEMRKKFGEGVGFAFTSGKEGGKLKIGEIGEIMEVMEVPGWGAHCGCFYLMSMDGLSVRKKDGEVFCYTEFDTESG